MQDVMESTATTVKPVLFVCPSGYEAILVMQSEDWTAVEGRAIKIQAHRINFRKKPFGGRYRGEYLATRQDEIDFIRKHEWFRPGPIPENVIDDLGPKGPSRGTSRFIYEVEHNPDLQRRAPVEVKQFDKPADAEVKAEPVPIESNPLPINAKISGSIKKRGRPPLARVTQPV